MPSASLRERINNARLYVLVDQRATTEAFSSLVQALVNAGTGVLQLRAKGLDDCELIERARRLRELTRRTNTLFIVNDRPDITLLAEADGVHLGQEDLSVEDARRVVGSDCLVGVSTHAVSQVRQAICDRADYIGCGPTFQSPTKHFEEFPGLDFLRSVHAMGPPPAFAIGGVNGDNLSRVLETGIRRVAVSSAVVGAHDPAVQVRRLTDEILAFSD